MKKAANLLKFATTNFGPLLSFYIANHLYGLKAGVLTSVVWTLAEIAYRYFLRKPIGTFFKFSAAIAIGFGLVDLYLQKSFLFKYEGALTNVMVGCFFAASLFSEKTVIREFAEAQGRIGKTVSPEAERFFVYLTLVWAVYSFAKAGFYVWVASRYSLEEGLAVRAVLGNASFYALLGISIFGSRPIINFMKRRAPTPGSA